ncbi:MAG TPA: Gfo/Idh/MocA family oxidoreductase [Bryobacteraceae bacterium]|nr:Gfo/Idh/MocA family oxidoreductase [Bryobacteraceae bacterium]
MAVIMESSTIARRNFFKGAAGAGAVLGQAPAVLGQRNVNDKIRVAMVGVGTRGIYLLERVQECPNTEIALICDLYDSNIQRAQKTAFNKKAETTKDWEKVVSSKNIDAVMIATPDFWHATMAVRAAQMKKHVYVEKGMCRTLDEAKAIRKAVRENGVTLQLGHHQNSESPFLKAREICQSGKLGEVCLARAYIDRTNPWPEWQFYTRYDNQVVPPDANPQTIDWERFQANSSVKTKFDPERFFRWRCWWEYGTGIAGDLMSHQWDGVNLVVGMGIPETVQTMGGLYFWTKDRDVPDQWHVMYEYPKKKLNVTFACTFHNRHHGTNTYIFGRNGTIEVASQWCRLYSPEWRGDYRDKVATARKKAESAGIDPTLSEMLVDPEYSWKRGELEVSSHQRDWIDCIRSGQTPRCGMDRAWEEAVTIVMSVESYFKERKVKWDPVNEQIV